MLLVMGPPPPPGISVMRQVAYQFAFVSQWHTMIGPMFLRGKAPDYKGYKQLTDDFRHWFEQQRKEYEHADTYTTHR
jgi:hypothetical protein